MAAYYDGNGNMHIPDSEIEVDRRSDVMRSTMDTLHTFESFLRVAREDAAYDDQHVKEARQTRQQNDAACSEKNKDSDKNKDSEDPTMDPAHITEKLIRARFPIFNSACYGL